MPRKPNDLKTEMLDVSTTPHVVRCLKELIKTGFYGKNAAEAAERLLSRTLEGMVREGTLKAPKNG